MSNMTPLKNSDFALNILSYYICDIFKFPEIHDKNTSNVKFIQKEDT